MRRRRGGKSKSTRAATSTSDGSRGGGHGFKVFVTFLVLGTGCLIYQLVPRKHVSTFEPKTLYGHTIGRRVPLLDWLRIDPKACDREEHESVVRRKSAPRELAKFLAERSWNTPVIIRNSVASCVWRAIASKDRKWTPRFLHSQLSQKVLHGVYIKPSPAETDQKSTRSLVFNRGSPQSQALVQTNADGDNKASPTSRIPELDRVFGPIWAGEKPMSEIPTVQWWNPHRLVDLPGGEFLEGVARNSEQWYHHRRTRNLSAADRVAAPDHYLYYVGIAEKLGVELMGDLYPLKDFLSTPEHSQVNVWMGQAGVVTHLHFDSYHNLNVQVFGSKRFVLYPPEDWTHMHPFPYLHPSYGQAHPDMTQPPPAYFPRLGNASGWEAVLREGDVLYIPPNWLHWVEALNFSVSVNAWSFSDESVLMEKIIEVLQKSVSSVNAFQGPRGSFMRRYAAVYMVSTVLDDLHTKLCGKAPNATCVGILGRRSTAIGWELRAKQHTVFAQAHLAAGLWATDAAGYLGLPASRQFVGDLVEARFGHLFAIGELLTLPQVPEKQLGELCPLTFSVPIHSEDRDRLSKATKPLLDHIVHGLAQLPARSRGVWIGNWVETVAFWATSARLMGSFLHQCF